jgi:hypothetical protein
MTSEPYCGRRWDRGDGARGTSRTADMPALLWIKAIVSVIVPVAYICYKSNRYGHTTRAMYIWYERSSDDYTGSMRLM